MKKTFLTIIALILTTTIAYSWDGKRQGFLLGAGAGAASVAYTNIDDLTSESCLWANTTSRIGYAWSDFSALELYGNTMGSNFSLSSINYQTWDQAAVNANSWFGGIGILSYSPSVYFYPGDAASREMGGAVNFGYAREFAAHASFEINMTIGGVKTQDYYIQGSELLKSGASTTNAFAGVSMSVSLLGY